MEVFLIFPKSKQAQQELGQELAKFHSEQALKNVQKLPCSHRLNFCSGTPSCVAYVFCVKPSRCRMALICAP